MSYLNDSLFPPLPDNLERALEEIRTLRILMFKEREQHVALVIKHVCDNRASTGNIRALREEIEGLRTEVNRLVGEVGNCDDCQKPAGIRVCLGCYEKKAVKDRSRSRKIA